MSRTVVVARIGRAHGIRGEVTVELRTDAPARRFQPGITFQVQVPAAARPQSVGALPQELTVRQVREHNGVFLLGFEQVGDRTGADALRGLLLLAAADADEEPDAWYPDQLRGLPVQDPAGRSVGEIVDLDTTAAQHRLLVRCLDGRVRMVPFVHQLVPVVDVAAGRVVVDAPAGLLED